MTVEPSWLRSSRFFSNTLSSPPTSNAKCPWAAMSGLPMTGASSLSTLTSLLACLMGSVWVDGAHLDPESSPLHPMQRPILSHDDDFDHVLVCERSNDNINRLAQLVGGRMCYCSLCN